MNIQPFAALLPKPELAGRICELPYDVMSTAEARSIAAGNPLSFLHVSKPEIDLPAETNPYDPKVYAQGRKSFLELIQQGALGRAQVPAFYLYRQATKEHRQLGLVALASCDEYRRGIIKKHELTRPDKEDDRVRHIETLEAQTGPAFLFYRSEGGLESFLENLASSRPHATDFQAPDGVRHTSWVLPGSDSRLMASLGAFLAELPSLYIADGHHRTAAAERAARSQPANPAAAGFLSVIFPHRQLRILPYNRVLKDLNGNSEAQLLEKLERSFQIEQPGSARPQTRHELGLYLGKSWRTLRFRPHLTATGDPFETLDVTLLQKQVLAPIFDVDDPRTSQRISFVGGIRGPEELERLVDRGESACAFSLFPTAIEELMTIADRGGSMPPKSTWFEPKLRDGMFCHWTGK